MRNPTINLGAVWRSKEWVGLIRPPVFAHSRRWRYPNFKIGRFESPQTEGGGMHRPAVVATPPRVGLLTGFRGYPTVSLRNTLHRRRMKVAQRLHQFPRQAGEFHPVILGAK